MIIVNKLGTFFSNFDHYMFLDLDICTLVQYLIY